MNKKALSQRHKRHVDSKSLNENIDVVAKSVTHVGGGNVTQLIDFKNLETLVTRSLNRYDTPSAPGGDNRDICDIKNTEAQIINRNVEVQNVLKWFEIAVSEGHIEPSQPTVGRLIGWPKRVFHFRSLWVDYCLWSSKIGDEINEVIEKKFFRRVVSLIFHIQDEEYVMFKSLDESRRRFETLREQIEYS